MQWLIIYHSEIEWTIWRIPIYCFYPTDGIFTCLLATWGLWGPSCLWRSGMLKRLLREGLLLPAKYKSKAWLAQNQSLPQCWPECLLLSYPYSSIPAHGILFSCPYLFIGNWKGLEKTLTWKLLGFSSRRFLVNLKLFCQKGIFTAL